ncbi:MAG: glutathione peroxidase [Leptospiraceae bacterium]|nr:glutathione peroxidase [Leptospiraceae bacterium]
MPFFLFFRVLLFLFFLPLYSSEFYKFKVKSIDGKETTLEKYKGFPVLVVNVASFCGYTGQYSNLESLYRKYKSKGLKILAFPANDFGSQEPNSNSEIAKFCKLKYDVSFDMMEKIVVVGKNKHPVYKFLIESSSSPNEEIAWNFEKFLLDKKGKTIGRFSSDINPESKEIEDKILQAINQP